MGPGTRACTFRSRPQPRGRQSVPEKSSEPERALVCSPTKAGNSKPSNWAFAGGALGGTRTPNLLIRSQRGVQKLQPRDEAVRAGVRCTGELVFGASFLFTAPVSVGGDHRVVGDGRRRTPVGIGGWEVRCVHWLGSLCALRSMRMTLLLGRDCHGGGEVGCEPQCGAAGQWQPHPCADRRMRECSS